MTPLTENSQLNGSALPTPKKNSHVLRGYEAPEGEIEAIVARIWAEAFQVERVGRRDDFFDLGGSSLLAVQVAVRLRQTLGVELGLRDVFGQPVLSEFARRIEIAKRPRLPAITPVERVEGVSQHALWQQKWMEREVLKEQAEYWRKNLEGAPELLELPADHPRPAQQDHAGAVVEFALEEKLTTLLKDLSERHGTTLDATLLAGWAVLLGRLSGQQDVVIGTPMANRGRVEIENLIGFFVNTLVLRVDVSGRPTVGERCWRG